MNDEQREALKSIARPMTAGDLSILEAALQDLSPERPTLLTTSPGSNNDKLWSAMIAVGWMSAGEPLDVPVPSKVYVINPEAKQEIGEFLADNARADAMTAILNDLRARIPPMIIDPVRGANGTPADLAIALAAVVESTMRRSIKPELHDEFLREVGRVSEAMRSV
jgi:hypothetical protein